MASLAEYLDGVIRVPLRLLTSNGFAECPVAFSDQAAVTDLDHFLNNSSAPITGIVTPEVMLDMLRHMGVTIARFRETIHGDNNPLHNLTVAVDCLVGPQCLSKAKEALGESFECWVRIYTLPPDIPGQFSDGQICRQLLLQSDSPQAVQKWLGKLGKGKRRHLNMLMKRPPIWAAMQAISRFPGLWEDIQIGNFAKHLAAHCDDSIVSYWQHIDKIWSTIFNGVEERVGALDAETVRKLQYRAPCRSNEDQQYLKKYLQNKQLFPEIRDEEDRAVLFRNITQHDVVIPSILTFHENMRYITIGIKIIEKFLLPPVKLASHPRLEKDRSLLTQLQQDWKSPNLFQVHEHNESFSFHHAFISILVDALKNFPYLSTETPLQDIKGEGMVAAPNGFYVRQLCIAASSYGFKSFGLSGGIATEAGSPIELPEAPKQLLARWRGGKPSIETFHHLQRKDSWTNIQALEDSSTCSPCWVVYDMLMAFFGTYKVWESSDLLANFVSVSTGETTRKRRHSEGRIFLEIPVPEANSDDSAPRDEPSRHKRQRSMLLQLDDVVSVPAVQRQRRSYLEVPEVSFSTDTSSGNVTFASVSTNSSTLPASASLPVHSVESTTGAGFQERQDSSVAVAMSYMQSRPEATELFETEDEPEFPDTRIVGPRTPPQVLDIEEML